MDSSALVKRYMAEAGTAWVQAWCNDPDHAVTVAEIGLVEVAATFAGKLRGGFIASKEYKDARNDLLIDAQSEYALVAVNRSLVDEAIELTARHRLRGYDAVHLACALFANRTLIEQGLPPLVFVCADNALLMAASAEGLATDNPNNPL
jgi:hypothetical protein